MSFPIGGPLERMSIYLQPFSRYCALSVYWGHEFDLSGSRDIIGHVTMVDMTLIRPLNKGQGHSFWRQSISYIRPKVYNFLPTGR